MTQRIYAMPPGADFPRALVLGLKARFAAQPPEALARVELILNTERMRRRITRLFIDEGAGFLPLLRLVTDLGADTPIPHLPPAVPPLRRRLELARLILPLVQGGLAPRSALFDLSDSLATLMDEMRGEGVHPDAIAALDVAGQSQHWQRTQQFMSIIAPLFADSAEPDAEARQRRVVEHLVRSWRQTPPAHPVIVAGSTGSRGTTAMLMQAVARLPQGMLVLPGFDFDMTEAAWTALGDAMSSEDHPQYRFRRLLDGVGITPADVQVWEASAPPDPARNRLISLSLRPAPVTDRWLVEGPDLPDLLVATKDMTLIEAADPRAEALAVALVLRGAAEEGKTAALVTPDRNLARQVASALDVWGIVPDDSAGRPLALTPPGRLLRHVARLFGQKLSSEALLTLLKHPLTASGGDRGNHLRLTHELELWLRRKGAPFPDQAVLNAWVDGQRDPLAGGWADWLGQTFGSLAAPSVLPLADHVARHIAVAEALAAGPAGASGGKLWQGEAGLKAAEAVQGLQQEAPAGGDFAPMDYRQLFEAVIGNAEVRDEHDVHPSIMIWGTLEARVQGADLLILGGLNDGIWPQISAPDPWMNRQMRKSAGLLLPDRKIGLSAHDYQQAMAARSVVLTRSTRDAEAETVPSRWLNRLINLMHGLPDKNGPVALDDMRRRGAGWLRHSAALEAATLATSATPRPSPAPPVEARPKVLSVTAIERLIRDPYAIYAQYVLGLRKLNPLRPEPDARLRGQILHKVLETFAQGPRDQPPEVARARLMAVAAQTLAAEIPWAAARLYWLARLDHAADFLLAFDASAGGAPVVLESEGRLALTPLDFTLVGRPDRIDALADGRLHIIDYKTGAPPSANEQQAFAKQLLLLAAMAERGGFESLGPAEVARISYVGLGTRPAAVQTDLSRDELGQVWEGLRRLITAYSLPNKGYSARRAAQRAQDGGDYDHLSRFGEWDLASPALTIRVGQ